MQPALKGRVVVLKTKQQNIYYFFTKKHLFLGALPVLLAAVELTCWGQSPRKEKIKMKTYLTFQSSVDELKIRKLTKIQIVIWLRRALLFLYDKITSRNIGLADSLTVRFDSIVSWNSHEDITVKIWIIWTTAIAGNICNANWC